jgi:hypothetical protein
MVVVVGCIVQLFAASMALLASTVIDLLQFCVGLLLRFFGELVKKLKKNEDYGED